VHHAEVMENEPMLSENARLNVKYTNVHDSPEWGMSNDIPALSMNTPLSTSLRGSFCRVYIYTHTNCIYIYINMHQRKEEKYKGG
jgi:hypothetical protein